MMTKLFRTFLFSFLIFATLYANNTPSQTLNIGILSFRLNSENQHVWQPLVDQIHASNPQLNINLISGSLDDIDTLIAQNKLDFVIVHPAAFVKLEHKYGISNIASIVRKSKVSGEHLSMYGGVIVTLASRHDIQTLADVRGKRIATTHKEGFAAMLMQQETLFEAGIDIRNECKMLYTGQPSDTPIKALINGEADIAFVRSGYLEEMIEKGEIKREDFSVINPRKEKSFPYLLSTSLYPEWAVASTSHPSSETIKAFTIALFQIHTDASKDFHEFGIPLSNQAARELMQKFHVYPFNNPPTFKEIIKENSLFLIVFFAFLALGSALFTLYYLLSSRRIKNQLKQIETILATATDGIHVHDKEGKLFLFSDSFAKIHGYTREEISKLRIYDLNTFFDPTKINSIMDQMKHQTLTFETKHTRKNGEMFDVEIHATEIDLDGKEYIYASLRDITQRKYSETILLQHDTILKNIAEGVYAIDNDGRCTYINPAALSLLNLKEEDILGYIPHEVFHYRHSDGETYTADECPIRNAAMQGSSTQLEDIFMRRDKSLFPVFVTVSPILQNDILIGSVVTFIDISDQKLAHDQLEAQKEHFDHMAHHDPLTGLPNRLSLIETLESLTTENETEPFALMFLDLDGFKEINDSYGHRFGDQILIQFAQVLQNTFPMDSIIVRTGGDEFVIILSYHDNPEMMISTIQKLLNKLNCPFTINNLDIYITVSIGVTNYPEHSINAEELFQQADAAMYNAKNMGKNTFSFYDAHFTEKALQRTTISTNLKRALLDNALELYFQPQVDSHSGKIIGAEALLRWPTLEGMIPPSLFIPIAEESGLILEVGEFVLYQGCQSAARWSSMGILHGRIAINISARQLTHIDFITTLDRIIQETQCNPEWIELEITESSILEYPEKIIALLGVIKSKGFKISIDDFGTGYSSLSYLKHLPIDKLKIDISFIRNITMEPKNQTIVKTIIDLAKGLRMTTIAEGVETLEELEFLRLNGIDSIQGYYYFRPMSIAQIEQSYKQQ